MPNQWEMILYCNIVSWAQTENDLWLCINLIVIPTDLIYFKKLNRSIKVLKSISYSLTYQSSKLKRINNVIKEIDSGESSVIEDSHTVILKLNTINTFIQFTLKIILEAPYLNFFLIFANRLAPLKAHSNILQANFQYKHPLSKWWH